MSTSYLTIADVGPAIERLHNAIRAAEALRDAIEEPFEKLVVLNETTRAQVTRHTSKDPTVLDEASDRLRRVIDMYTTGRAA